VPVESELSERAPASDPGPADPTTEASPPAPATGDRVEAGSPSQVRRVRRILRRIDPLSVLKLSFIFFVCMYGVIVVSSLLVWRVAVTSGVIDDLEEFIVDLGFKDFDFAPDQMFQALMFGGAGMIIVATFLAVLGAVLFNLISDLVGGIKISMIEEHLLDDETS
jgi:hypothetical protein